MPILFTERLAPPEFETVNIWFAETPTAIFEKSKGDAGAMEILRGNRSNVAVMVRSADTLLKV
jgi:hypothetical protein